MKRKRIAGVCIGPLLCTRTMLRQPVGTENDILNNSSGRISRTVCDDLNAICGGGANPGEPVLITRSQNYSGYILPPRQ